MSTDQPLAEEPGAPPEVSYAELARRLLDDHAELFSSAAPRRWTPRIVSLRGAGAGRERPHAPRRSGQLALPLHPVLRVHRPPRMQR